jgi:hypothetical protein
MSNVGLFRKRMECSTGRSNGTLLPQKWIWILQGRMPLCFWVRMFEAAQLSRGIA